MAIDLKNFVNINIQPAEKSTIEGTRGTVVLFIANTGATFDGYVSSYQDYINFCTENNIIARSQVNTIVDIFFTMNGYRLHLISCEFDESGEAIIAALANLPTNEIMIMAVDETAMETNNAAEALKAAALHNEQQNVYGIDEKVFITNADVSAEFTEDTESIKNLIIKYGSRGNEATVAAYLSNINYYETDTVHDYMFTVENYTTQAGLTNEGIDLTNEQYLDLISNNYNVDIDIANSIRNMGGNCKDGEDLVNNFSRIVLHQTLTERLVELLAQKLKSTSGISKIYATICSELERYKNAGYHTTDKIWTKEDLKISRNGVTYTIVEKGTPLTNGYIVTILPMTALTDEERAERSAPPIYVILADQYGIRKMTISGEII